MNTAETIEPLRHCNDNLPEKALLAATGNRSEIRPCLLEELSKLPQEISAQGNDLFFFAMFLVAEMRETEACPLLINFYSTPGETADNTMGDVVTEPLWKILASTYNGDPELLQSLAENKHASIWCRCSALKSFLVLLNEGVLQRNDVVSYFRYLFSIISHDDDSYFCSSLISDCCTIYPGEMMGEIRRAFDLGLVDPMVIGLDDVEQALEKESQQGFSGWRRDEYRFMRRVTDELRHWYGFSEEYRRFKRKQSKKPYSENIIQPVRNTPKIGRNDPFPCGSGKKFKKCCGTPARNIH